MEEQTDYSLEDLFSEIEDTITKLENPDISLEESFQLYEAGIKKIHLCNAGIDKVEKKMLVLNGEGELEEF